MIKKTHSNIKTIYFNKFSDLFVNDILLRKSGLSILYSIFTITTNLCNLFRKAINTPLLLLVMFIVLTGNVAYGQTPVAFGQNPGLVYWLKGDLGVTGTSPVTAWADQSGNNNNASQVTTGPDQIVSASMNNQYVMSFGGANNMTIANDSRINTGGGYNGDQRSMFIAFKTGADVTATQYLYEEGGGNNGLGVFIKNNNIYVIVYNNNGNNRVAVYNSVVANTPYVLSFLWNSGALSAKLNNVDFTGQSSNGTITTLNTHGGAISIGYTDGNTRNEAGNTEGGPAYLTGEVAEILYYDETLTNSEEVSTNDILAQRYGIGFKNQIYYSYQSGNWNVASTWTSDPGGTTQVGTTIPGNGDIVFILSGRTITLPSDVDSTGLDVTIRSGGVLDLSTYQFTGGLMALRGQGTFRLASVNFPSTTLNTFVNAGGGTTEYYNASNFTFPAAQSTYNNLTINANGVIGTQLSDITLNGDLYVKQGTYRINDNTSTTKLTLTVDGNVTVDNGASITVGTGVTNSTTNPLNITGGTAPFINYYTQFHTVIIKGDFTNSGTVRFTNLTYPVYNAFPPTTSGPTSGAASVYFMGASDNTLTCNGTTDFYNLILDKGVDQTFKLNIYSSAYQNFRLFGANIAGGDGGGNNPNLKKALWIRTGTLVLKGLTIIPSLSEGTCAEGGADPNSDFYIPANGALILDGSDVVVLSTADDYREVNVAYGVSGGSGQVNGVSLSGCSSYSIYGKLQINNGYFSTRESGGFITWDVASGQFVINGGIVDAKQFRAAGGTGGLASFEQTGGTLILRGRFQRTPVQYTSVNDLKDFSEATLNTNRITASLDGSLGSFNLNSAANVFIMSGGTIRIYDACGTGGRTFDVFSSANNINVTGGTLEIIPTTGSGGGGDAANYLITSTAPLGNLLINRMSSTSNVQLNTYPLNVLGNLTLSSGVLVANNLNVSIGGNYTVASGTTYTPGNNWTIFNGSGSQSFTVNTAAAFSLKKFKVDKPSGTTLTLAGSQSTINVSDSVMLIKGTLNDGGKTINFTTSGTTTTSYLYNSGIHTGTGKIMLADDDPQVISGDGNGIFQNLDLNNTDGSAAPVSLAANITVNGSLTFSQDKLFNINTYNLKFNSGATIINGGANRYIETSGNAGDGGLTFVYPSASAITFPVGAASTSHATPSYTPATIGFSTAPTTLGSITVIPVGYEHPSTTVKGQSLTYFWHVTSSGFTGIAPNSIIHTFTYSQSDVVGTESNYIPSLYERTTYTWYNGTNANPPINTATNTISDWTTPGNSTNYLDADYTAGDNSFGTPTKFYSIANGNWNNNNTWSNTSGGPPAATIPGTNDIVIIENNHTVTLTQNENCASLQIESGSTLDIYTYTGSNFGMVLNHPNGNGLFRVTTPAAPSNTVPQFFTFPSGDFSDFNLNGGTTEFYDIDGTVGALYILPPTVTSYGNLILRARGGDNLVLPNNSYTTIHGDLTCTGNATTAWVALAWNTNVWPYYTNDYNPVIEKTVHVEGNLYVDAGTLIYLNNEVPQHLIVDGDITVASGAVMQVYNNYPFNPVQNNTLEIGGSLINNNEATFRNGNYHCDVTFFGSNSASITNTSGTPTTIFNNVTVNKGISQDTTLTVDISGTLNTPNDGWLTLQNGTFKYIRTGDLNITQGSTFTIPGSAGLYINTPSTVYIANNNSSNNDVYLNGKLTLINGNIYVGPTAAPNYNNDIEYSGGGQSEIEIQGGNLVVNGQIRRNPATTSGVLKYTQSNGTVKINGNAANTTNAKLEILNGGSEFNMSGGTITIERGGGGNTYGDLYLRPASSSVTGGEIIFTQGTYNSVQNYILDATVPLNDLTITGTNNKDATVKLLISPLVLKGTLTLTNTYSIFDANTDYDIDVTIKGDLDNNGTYNHYNNLTTFSGDVQTITGSSVTDFYNLTVNPITRVILSKDVTVNNDLTLSNGTLECSTYKVSVKGNVTNNATYTDTNAGLVLNGTALQYLSGTGTFGQMELNNSAGARLNNGITLQKDLILSNGILDINKYMLTLEQNSNIQGAPFSSSKMITSDGVFSNVGIKKYIGTGATTFTYPIGTSGKYTPAELTVTANTNVGFIRINNINHSHPAVIDPANVLDYFWEVESFNITGFSGNLVFNYLDEDVMGTQENNYIAARLIIPGTSWSKTSTVDDAANTITFNYTGTDNLSGEYTAGLDAAFPDDVPVYTTNSDGNWTNQSIWTQTGGTTYPCPPGGPNGFIVIIDHEVTANANYCLAYRTTINGKLKIVSPYYGHNLGTVNGNGTLYLESGVFPAGRYTSFLDCSSGGTIEYGGTGTYTIIADLFSNIPNLTFSGTGTRKLPNKDLTICNRLMIDGPTLDNSENNRKLTILGTMERYNTGAFKSGSGSGATVTFAGTSAQTLGGSLGDFTGSNAFNNLEIDNSAGLSIDTNGDIEVSGNLLLTDGLINTSSTNKLTITNTAINCVVPAGGSSSSYVNGPLIKMINQSDDFQFPIGDASNLGNKLTISSTQTGPILWTTTYYNPNTNTTYASPLTAVNTKEYWEIVPASANQAIVNLMWDPYSDLTPLMTQNGLSDMRVGEHNGTDWVEVASTASGDNMNGSVETSSRISFPVAGNLVTVACINTTKPRASLTPTGPVCGSAGIPVTFTSSFPISLNYTISYKLNNVAQTPITVSSLPYTLPTPTPGTYQLTGFTYDNGVGTGVVDLTAVTTYAVPTTANAGTDQSLCGATSATLAGNTPAVGTGQWTITSGSGGTVVTPSDPASTFNGTNGSSYTLQWTISNGTCTSLDTVTIAFPLLPVTPPNFTTSSNSVCQGQTNVIYTVPNDPSASSYNWSYSGTGATINGTTNSVSLDFDNTATSGTISVSTTNGCGTSADLTLNITVNPLPTQPGAYTTSSAMVCMGDTNVLYSVPNDPTVTYNWNYSGTGVTINGTTNLVGLDFDILNASSGTLGVSATNSCGTSAARTIDITVNPVPSPVIAGDTNVCEEAEIVYTTPVNGSDTYSWSVNGGAITSGQNTNTITVTWDMLSPVGTKKGTGTIQVTETTPAPANCATTTPDYNVSVYRRPETGPDYHIPNTY